MNQLNYYTSPLLITDGTDDLVRAFHCEDGDCEPETFFTRSYTHLMDTFSKNFDKFTESETTYNFTNDNCYVDCLIESNETTMDEKSTISNYNHLLNEYGTDSDYPIKLTPPSTFKLSNANYHKQHIVKPTKTTKKKKPRMKKNPTRKKKKTATFNFNHMKSHAAASINTTAGHQFPTAVYKTSKYDLLFELSRDEYFNNEIIMELAVVVNHPIHGTQLETIEENSHGRNPIGTQRDVKRIDKGGTILLIKRISFDISSFHYKKAPFILKIYLKNNTTKSKIGLYHSNTFKCYAKKKKKINKNKK